jgi:hypothetical protein
MNHRRRAVDQFTLVRVGPDDWVLQNGRFSRRDARHVVAALHETGNGDVDVLWLEHTTLPTRYSNVADALEDFVRWSSPSAGRRPVAIPHFQPLLPARSA